MKRLLHYLKAYRKEAVLAPLFKMFEAVLELLVPLIVADMIDTGIKNQDTAYILQRGALLFLLAAAGLAASFTAQYFSAKAAVMTGTAIRSDLFRHIQSLSWSQIDEVGTSTLITRMTSDINTVQNGINMFLRLFLRSPFVVFGAMVMAFICDFRTALIFAVIIPVLLLIVFAILLITMPLYRKVQKQLDVILRAVRENLIGVRVVRAFNRQADETGSFEKESTVLYRGQTFVGRISALLNPVTYALINIGIVAILWTGGSQVDLGRLSQGSVIALINYMSQILVELVKLANLIILLSRAAASMNRVDSVFRIENTREDGACPCPEDPEGASISFEHVTFSYTPGAAPALSDISFNTRPGAVLGIIGGTGAGKSTLVNLLPRFYDAGEGSIRINGTDIREMQEADLRMHIGLVPQKAVLIRGTLKENMLWGNENASDGEIYAALETAQAKEFVDSKDEGLDLMIEQEGRSLSGGQRQRLTIARAIIRKPDILILDDSASALDFATDARLRKAIRKEGASRCVILVSQRVGTIRNADQILVLDDGRLAGSGTHRQLLKSCDVYREICESQLTADEIRRDLAEGKEA